MQRIPFYFYFYFCFRRNSELLSTRASTSPSFVIGTRNLHQVQSGFLIFCYGNLELGSSLASQVPSWRFTWCKFQVLVTKDEEVKALVDASSEFWTPVTVRVWVWKQEKGERRDKRKEEREERVKKRWERRENK